jgi:hypothetical protein
MRLGGAWCSGFFNPNDWLVASPGPSISIPSSWTMLVDDPLGRDYTVLRTYITQGVYLADPGSPRLRAEIQTRVSQLNWGDLHTYQWRMICPQNVVNHGPDVYVIVLQCHDQNAVNVARRPTFDIAYHDGRLEAKLARSADPFGMDIWDRVIAPGEEIEITVRAKWADGTHVAAAEGLFELYVNGALVYQLAGEKNTWDSGTPAEDYPPFLKAGVYQSQNDEATWEGKDFTWYHVGSIVSNEGDSPAALRAVIDAGLAATPAREKMLLAWKI